MNTKSIKETLKFIEDLKRQRDETFESIDKLKPYLSKENSSPINIDVEPLKKMKEEIENTADQLENSLINRNNKKASSFEHFHKKVANEGDVTDEDEKKLIELYGKYHEREKVSVAEECFHFDHGNCNGGIIYAHSIQENGGLKTISEKGGNEFNVISFDRSYNETLKTDKPVSISTASTFRGFCHTHDGIFSAIEKKEFDGSFEHLFFHSYRAFAQSYQRVKEKHEIHLNLFSGLSNALSGLVDAGRMSPNENQLKTMNAEKYENHKTLLNGYLKNRDFGQLDYLTIELDYVAPIACSSWLTEHVFVNNNFLIDYSNLPYNGYPLMLTTVVPSRSLKTLIILARFKKDQATEILFTRLKNMEQEKQEFLLSSWIFNRTENFFISPKFWNKISDELKKEILDNINSKRVHFPEVSNFRSTINIFDENYKIEFS